MIHRGVLVKTRPIRRSFESLLPGYKTEIFQIFKFPSNTEVKFGFAKFILRNFLIANQKSIEEKSSFFITSIAIFDIFFDVTTPQYWNMTKMLQVSKTARFSRSMAKTHLISTTSSYVKNWSFHFLLWETFDHLRRISEDAVVKLTEKFELAE